MTGRDLGRPTLHWIDAFADTLGMPFEEIAQALAGGIGRELLEPEEDEVVGATANMVLTPGIMYRFTRMTRYGQDYVSPKSQMPFSWTIWPARGCTSILQ